MVGKIPACAFPVAIVGTLVNGKANFIGEVLEVYVSKDRFTDGRPDLIKINPLLLGGSPLSYWNLGDQAGVVFKEGKALIKK